MTALRDGRSGVQILVETRDFSLLRNVQNGSGFNTALYSMDCGGKAAGT